MENKFCYTFKNFTIQRSLIVVSISKLVSKIQGLSISKFLEVEISDWALYSNSNDILNSQYFKYKRP